MRKLLSAALVMGVITSTSLTPMAFADVSANMLPSLGSAENATVTAPADNYMNIQVNGGLGGVGNLNWNSFNVGKDATVNYEFTNHNQTALNRVDAAGGLSQIYGSITNSGCANCGYEATGKVILINPNGVLFGAGANVNLNSFTVSTMDGTFDEAKNQLNLDRTGTSQYGIIVQDGAQIYGDKGVTFASDNVSLYNGSKITTNVGNNVGNAAFGKIKIVTSDGVNFTYYNNGAISDISGIKNASDKMTVSVNGQLESGNIDIRNYSSNVDSQINLNGAVLKATKAVLGNDGNIWLTASNKVVVDNSNLTTAYSTQPMDDSIDTSAITKTGNIKILAGSNASVKSSTLDAINNVDIASENGNVVVQASKINAVETAEFNAGKIATIQGASEVNAADISIAGKERAQAVESKLTAVNDVVLSSQGERVWTNNAEIKAGNDVTAMADNGFLFLENSKIEADNDINLISKDSITTTKLADSEFKAGNEITLNSLEGSVLLTSTDQFNHENGKLNLSAGKNVEINTEADNTVANVNITAGENAFLTSKGSLTVNDTTSFLAADKVYLIADQDVRTAGDLDMNNIQTNIKAGNDVDVNLLNVGVRENGLVAEAGNNMVIATPGTLSVSSLIAGNDMWLVSDKVIAGHPYTEAYLREEGDSADRAYIYVGGTFNSITANDSYEVTDSAGLTNDGNYYKRHHIQYGEGTEKILLVNKRPVENVITPPEIPDIDNGDGADIVDPGDVDEDLTETPEPGPSFPPVDPDPEEPDTPVDPDQPCEDETTPNPDEIVDEETPDLSNSNTESGDDDVVVETPDVDNGETDTETDTGTETETSNDDIQEVFAQAASIDVEKASSSAMQYTVQSKEEEKF